MLDHAPPKLRPLSLEQLANVEVTSVSKTAEPLSRAPAAIYVITHEQILRSGATNIPEVLRLAPNLQVRQLTDNSYAVTARGFGGHQGDQNFSNKLLMLWTHRGAQRRPGPHHTISSRAHCR